MPAAEVPLVIDQGEDWTSEVVWTDNYDEPVIIVHPCRMDIRAATGQTIATLETDPDIPDGEIPSINLSPDIGLIQLHIPRTQTVTFTPGVYHYDLFVTCDDGNEFSGLQVARILYGQVTVNKRVTQMTE
jgi:hypothetical protein